MCTELRTILNKDDSQDTDGWMMTDGYGYEDFMKAAAGSWEELGKPLLKKECLGSRRPGEKTGL